MLSFFEFPSPISSTSKAEVTNIIEGIVSYLPGATILDQGLSRIAQKRMLKQTLYKVSEALGVEIKPWHERVYEKIFEKIESGPA